MATTLSMPFASYENGLFGNKVKEAQRSSWFDIVNKEEATLVASCLDLEPSSFSADQHHDCIDGTQYDIPIKQEEPDFSMPDFSMGTSLSTRDAMQDTEEKKVNLSSLDATMAHHTRKRDALDDEIDALLNWRPKRKILLSDSDKKLAHKKGTWGLNSSELDLLLSLCKGCKECNLAAIKGTGFRKNRNEAMGIKSGSHLSSRNKNFVYAQKRELRRSIRNQSDGDSFRMLDGSSNRPRTRSQLMHFKGRHDLATGVESSNLKVLRSRSFLPAKTLKGAGEKQKLKENINRIVKGAGVALPSQQTKARSIRKRSRSQFWFRKRRRTRQRNTVSTLKTEADDSTKTDPSSKSRVKTSRWDDFIRRQREALQQFEGDGKVQDKGVSKESGAVSTEEKISEDGEPFQETNLFEKLKMENDCMVEADKVSSLHISESQIKELQAVFKSPGAAKPVKATSEEYKLVTSMESADKARQNSADKSSTSPVTSTQPTGHNTLRLLQLPMLKADPNTVATTTCSSNAPSQPKSLVIQSFGQSVRSTGSSQSSGNSKVPFYVPVNIQGRTVLCPVLPATSEMLKNPRLKPMLNQTQAAISSKPVLTSAVTTPSQTTAETSPNTLEVSSKLPVSSVSGRGPGHLSISLPGPVSTIASPSVPQSPLSSTPGRKSLLVTNKLKTILPMPGGSPGTPSFPHLVVLRPHVALDKMITSVSSEKDATSTRSSVATSVSSTESREVSAFSSTADIDPEKKATVVTAAAGASSLATSSCISQALMSVSASSSASDVQNQIKTRPSPSTVPLLLPTIASLASTSGSPTVLTAGMLNGATLLGPVNMFGSGVSQQLLSGTNIRLGVPLTLSAAKQADGGGILKGLIKPAFDTSQTANKGIKIPSASVNQLVTSLCTALDSKGIHTRTTAAMQQQNASHATAVTKTASAGAVTNSGTSLVSMTSALSGKNLADCSPTFTHLHNVKWQPSLSKRWRRKHRHRRRNKRGKRHRAFSSSESSVDGQQLHEEDEEDDFPLAIDADALEEGASQHPSDHPYNTRLKTKHNKLKFVRTDNNTWKIAESVTPDSSDRERNKTKLTKCNNKISDVCPSKALSDAEQDDTCKHGDPLKGMLTNVNVKSHSHSSQPTQSLPPTTSSPIVSSPQASFISVENLKNLCRSGGVTLIRPVLPPSSDRLSNSQNSLTYRHGQPSGLKTSAPLTQSTALSLCKGPALQQLKTVSPGQPFNALLLKQPDGTYKLQFLQTSHATTTAPKSSPGNGTQLRYLQLPSSALTTTATVSSVFTSSHQAKNALFSALEVKTTPKALTGINQTTVSSHQESKQQGTNLGSPVTIVPVAPKVNLSADKAFICDANKHTSPIFTQLKSNSTTSDKVDESNDTMNVEPCISEVTLDNDACRVGSWSDHLYAKLKNEQYRKGGKICNLPSLSTLTSQPKPSGSDGEVALKTISDFELPRRKKRVYFEDLEQIRLSELGQKETQFSMGRKDVAAKVTPNATDTKKFTAYCGLERVVSFLNRSNQKNNNKIM